MRWRPGDRIVWRDRAAGVDLSLATTARAAEVEAVVAARESPFRDGWERFRPDPAWPVGPLPAEDLARAGLDQR